MDSLALTNLPSRTIPHSWGLVSLRTALFSLIWILILLAASYDAYFAWQYRAVLDAWEMNPFILWLAGIGGLASVFLFKLFSMVLSTAVAIHCHHRRHRLEIPFTLVVAGVYFLLSFHYLVSHLQAS
jgi:hypothetical protein